MTAAWIDDWAQGVQSRDAGTLSALLDPDVVLHSPLTNAFVFRGSTAVSNVFDAAFELIGDIRVHTRLADDHSGVVVFAGVVAGAPMEEMHLLRRTDDDRIGDITIMGRPVPALVHVMGAIPARLAARGTMPPAAGRAAVGIKPIAALLGAIDAHLVPRLPPR